MDPHRQIKSQPLRVRIDRSVPWKTSSMLQWTDTWPKNSHLIGFPWSLHVKREANKDPATTRPQHEGSQDVEMESIRFSYRGFRLEYNPDDVDFPTSAQATVATAASESTDSTMIQRGRISAISDRKEFTGKDQDEDRAQGRISKMKSGFISPRWIRQELVSSTRNKYSDLLRSFQIQYCGLGVSVARQYYHTRRRSDESPLDYLFRLYVERLRARPKVKGGSGKDRREHVNHYSEAFEDQNLAERLILLRLTDADDLEEALRTRYREKNRQKKAAFGSGKYHQKTTNAAPPLQRNKVVRSGSKLTTLDLTVNLMDRVDPTRTSIIIAGSSLQRRKTLP
ncbi:hypothetical protein PHMEG_0005339 [Phytophthora megakarya]|uniref:Uncharacterized protein n=1 Tax=Phytophthora megakarya TaxID=4795 RepID=A0A225WRL9_9STRA|nr:hypothetical protein PHMEG_0005339 [Phytophthora megakarya]